MRNFLGGFFGEDFFGRNFFGRNSLEIDLFVKILVFVKILFQWRRKEDEFLILRSARGKLIAFKDPYEASKSL